MPYYQLDLSNKLQVNLNRNKTGCFWNLRRKVLAILPTLIVLMCLGCVVEHMPTCAFIRHHFQVLWDDFSAFCWSRFINATKKCWSIFYPAQVSFTTLYRMGTCRAHGTAYVIPWIDENFISRKAWLEYHTVCSSWEIKWWVPHVAFRMYLCCQCHVT